MQKGKDIILVTGATGKQGGAVARELLSHGHKVRAMTRKPQDPPALELKKLGAETVQGDLNDSKSLEAALTGAYGVFAVQNTWEAGVEGEEVQGKRVAELAKKKNVQHYVYTSVGSADQKTGIPHFENKFRIEEAVRKAGFPTTVILRPVFFMDNFLTPWFKPGIDQGKLMIGIKPATPLQMIAVEDIGKFGRLAFEDPAKMNRKAIELAGDQHTMPQAAEILGRVIGKKIEFVEVPKDEVRKMSADYAMMLDWFDKVGYHTDIPGLEKEYGIKLTKLSSWAAKQKWS